MHIQVNHVQGVCSLVIDTNIAFFDLLILSGYTVFKNVAKFNGNKMNIMKTIYFTVS